MFVIKTMGNGIPVSFSGTEKAVNTFTAIHSVLSSRGYGISIPPKGYSDTFSIPWVGRVRLSCESASLCHVEHLQGGFRSFIYHQFGK